LLGEVFRPPSTGGAAAVCVCRFPVEVITVAAGLHDPWWRGTASVRCRYAVGGRVYVLGVGVGQVIFGLTPM
jgi:hypothetical protein